MKITFTIFTTFKFIEDSILKWTKALSTPMQKEKFSRILWNNCRWTFFFKNIESYTKHWVCHNSPFELTIFSCGSNPSSHLVQNMFPSALAAITLLYFEISNFFIFHWIFKIMRGSKYFVSDKYVIVNVQINKKR